MAGSQPPDRRPRWLTAAIRLAARCMGPRVHLMSDHPATVRGTRRQAAVRGAIAALAAGGASHSLLVVAVAIVSPSPTIVVVLCACAVATGVLVAGSVPRARLVRGTGARAGAAR